MPFDCDLGEVMYAERLGNLFQELQSGHSPVFGLMYC